MQGYLQLWQGIISRWVSYYFRIHQDTLLFGKNREDVEYKVHLKVAQVVTTIDDPIGLMIHTGIQTIHIRANSIDERVRWYKKLKSIQSQVQNAIHQKEMNQLDRQLGKNSRVKVLQQLNVELWKAQADLQNILQDLKSWTRIPPMAKGTLDKLRITAQQIKFKNSESLQLIQQYIVDIKNRRNNAESVNDILSNRRDIDNSKLDITQYLSFYEDRKDNANGKHKKRKIFEQRNNETYYKSFNEMKMEKVNDLSDHHVFSRSGQVQSNNLKQLLLQKNQVYKLPNFQISRQRYRDQLPCSFTPQQKFPLLSVLSGSIGADITKMSLPVTINQPLSILQKACEQMYYSELLDQADEQIDPALRMLYVTAFVISQYSLTDCRIKKPFNPLLGQTFYYVDEKRDFQFLGEQVSHHPPISAVHCRSNHFDLIDNSSSKTSFTGSSIKVVPLSKARVTLSKQRDTYIWNKCTLCMNGLLMGKTYIENYGDVCIKCEKYQTQAEITFNQSSFWKKTQLNSFEGWISYKKEKIFKVTGKWNEIIQALNMKRNMEKTTLWRRTHVNNERYYNFNEMTFQLNHLSKEVFQEIPPTDSRLRPDQRALEFQSIDLAMKQKNRLEEKQRARRKQYQMSNKKHQPLWFIEKRQPQDQYYVNNDLYWESKRNGLWNQCLDIY